MSYQEIVSIVKMHDKSDIYESIRSGFKLIGHPSFHQGDVVAIKPNLCCIKGSETGATTDLRVVEAIIRYLQEEFHVSDISIVESDGTQLLADMAFKLLGYENLSKRLNVKLINLSKEPFSYKVYETNIFLKKVKIPETLERATCLISVPKIKIHTMCSFGGTMKNQYGCNPVPKKSIYHGHLHDCIVDLTAVFKPQLIVVDGIIGMEGRGPVCGVPVKMNTLIFGRDVVAVDHLIARLIGINPNKVKYLVDAQKRGLGTTNYQIAGASLKEVERRFNCPPKSSNLYGLLSL
jgi:uncharacterized protein (DUF362 family)